MRSVFFGLGLEYDGGSSPSVSMNRHGRVVEVHKNELGLTLYSRIGAIDQMNVTWQASAEYTGGVDPCVAVNAGGIVVEVHKNEAGTTVYYLVGVAGDEEVDWGPSRDYDNGINPGVALNDAGVAIEVHRTQNIFSDGLYYRVGPVQGDEVKWGGSDEFANGDHPRIALNNNNDVVVVYDKNGQVRYRTGTVDPSDKEASFNDERGLESGGRPAVALADDGTVIVVYTFASQLYQRVGRINGEDIDWVTGWEYYDDGVYPSVAMAGNLAIETHEGELANSLWYATSILTDRASWMQDRLATLGSTPLGSLVLPASHDAGMYTGDGFEVFGKTQELSIYGQLAYGIRWFDLRPRYDDGVFYICHGPITGPPLSDVLDQVRDFCLEGHRELAILKLSHFDGIDDDTYETMVGQITDKIGTWLVNSTVAGKRLVQMTLNEYVSDGPAVLIVVDANYAIDRPARGFWVYRDWESADPAAGDLRVYDIYSDTMLFDTMKTGQFDAFNNYDGLCEKDPSVPCDLFLLSWTLTPPTFVWLEAKIADRQLGISMPELTIPNRFGKIVNMLYVDYSEFARVTDVALVENGESLPLATAASKSQAPTLVRDSAVAP
jgi:hypothetical protein